MEKIILLDYQTGLVHIFEGQNRKNFGDKISKWFGQNGICFSECEWMTYDGIIKHKTGENL
jgi:hypothetical protein